MRQPNDPLWQELQESLEAKGHHALDAMDVAQHIINSECLAHTHRLVAVLKLVRLELVSLDQVIVLAEAHLTEIPDDERDEV